MDWLVERLWLLRQHVCWSTKWRWAPLMRPPLTMIWTWTSLAQTNTLHPHMMQPHRYGTHACHGWVCISHLSFVLAESSDRGKIVGDHLVEERS